MVHLQFVFAIVFFIGFCSHVTAQQKVFDVHLHGSGQVENQFNALADAGVYQVAISSSWDLQQQYKSQEKVKVLRGLMFPCPNGKVPYSLQPCFADGGEWPSLTWVEDQIKAGKIDFIGEVLSQYYGISCSDSLLMPYYMLAKKYDIPVGIHTGSAGPDHGCPNFRQDMGNPMLMEKLLTEIPGLRLWIMHAGTPYHKEAIDIMKKFPNVYADVSAINNPEILPPSLFASVMRLYIDNGLEDRIMFGSDNGDIQKMINSITQLPFLTDEQKQKIFSSNAERFFTR